MHQRALSVAVVVTTNAWDFH